MLEDMIKYVKYIPINMRLVTFLYLISKKKKKKKNMTCVSMVALHSNMQSHICKKAITKLTIQSHAGIQECIITLQINIKEVLIVLVCY